MFILLMLRVADLLAKTKAAARREHRQLQQFLEAIPIGVCVRDAVTGEPAYVNRFANELLGYDPGEVPSPYDLPNLYVSGTDEAYPPSRLPIVHALRGETASVDNIEVAVDQQRRRLSVVGTPIREEDRVRYALTAFADITAERQMAEELRKLADIDPLTGGQQSPRLPAGSPRAARSRPAGAPRSGSSLRRSRRAEVDQRYARSCHRRPGHTTYSQPLEGQCPPVRCGGPGRWRRVLRTAR